MSATADGGSRRFVIIIPARYDSTRYPGKPLASLRGARGVAKPLIQRSWECAVTITEPDAIWVATDDERIAATVRGFGGQVVMTGRDRRNGTERCAEAIERLAVDVDAVVNLQGDAPLTPAFVVDALVAALAEDRTAMVATPAVACSASLFRHLLTDQAAGRVGGTTVVSASDGGALYFSKRIIPHVPPSLTATGHEHVRLHLGIYAYRPQALRRYAASAPTALEQLEGLEQLRFLDQNLRIVAVPFDPLPWDCIELNNPQDVEQIEAILAKRAID